MKPTRPAVIWFGRMRGNLPFMDKTGGRVGSADRHARHLWQAITDEAEVAFSSLAAQSDKLIARPLASHGQVFAVRCQIGQWPRQTKWEEYRLRLQA